MVETCDPTTISSSCLTPQDLKKSEILLLKVGLCVIGVNSTLTNLSNKPTLAELQDMFHHMLTACLIVMNCFSKNLLSLSPIAQRTLISELIEDWKTKLSSMSNEMIIQDFPTLVESSFKDSIHDKFLFPLSLYRQSFYFPIFQNLEDLVIYLLTLNVDGLQKFYEHICLTKK